jgi:pimeloyl-ACP methyl ester carboxylesterase
MDFESIFIPVSTPTRRSIHVSRRSGNEATELPLVFLHGLGSATSFWMPVILSETWHPALSERTMICIDHDGHGLTPWSGRTVAGMQTYVDDVKVVLTSLGIGRFILIAHSMSSVSKVFERDDGMLKAGWGNELTDWECRLSQLIAAMYAVQNPQKVAKLGEPKCHKHLFCEKL